MKKYLLLITCAACLLTATALQAATCKPVSVSYLQSGLGDMTTDADDIWTWDGSYNCAKARKVGGGEGHLFTPAVDLSGVDEIIVFRPLAQEEMQAIAGLMLESVKARLRERGIALTVTPEAEALLSGSGFDPLYGARPLRRAIQHQVEDSLSEEILAGHITLGDAVTAFAEDGKLVFRKDAPVSC